MFEFIEDELYRDTLIRTYRAITNVNAWEFMMTFSPDTEKGFMFSSHPILGDIYEETERMGVGHSGASWGITMRSMEMIAKEGLQKFVQSSSRSAGP